MNIAVIGTGYVGLVTGACFADVGNNVICIDKVEEKIENLKKGIMPIYEPGLESIVQENLKEGRLKFSIDLRDAIGNTLFFLAVGTPQGENGSADLKYVFEAAHEVGKLIKGYSIIVSKSTVPVGTTEKIKEIIQQEIDSRGLQISFDVISNPEFLKQGAAVADFMKPDRVIIGCNSDRAKEYMKQLYAPFIRSHDRLLFMGIRAAEMSKYASNSMLAAKISFMNEIALICEKLGVDVESVRQGMGADNRIGYSFIYPGCGYGGSCFPKDVKALINIAQNNKFEAEILKAVDKRNEDQKRILVEKIIRRFGTNLSKFTFGLWGLAFKPGTDDMREAPSIVILKELINAGAKVKAYDPVAVETAKAVLPSDWFESGRMTFAAHQYDAVTDVNALIVVTEWKSFRTPDFNFIKSVMNTPVIFDGRNLYDPQKLKVDGLEYYGIGR